MEVGIFLKENVGNVSSVLKGKVRILLCALLALTRVLLFYGHIPRPVILTSKCLGLTKE
jgi:hypothetical protein